MFRFDFQKVWVVYLITSYTVFTIPEPVFAQNPVYIRNGTNPAEPTGGGSNDAGGGGEGGAEPMVSASSTSLQNAMEEDNVIAEESQNNNRFRGGPLPPRKNQNGHGLNSGRPPRRHPPPNKMSPIPPPPQRPHMIKQGKLNKPKPVPKYNHKDSHERDNRLPRPPPPHPPPRDNSFEESRENKFRPSPKDMDNSGSNEFMPSGRSAEMNSRERNRPPPPPPMPQQPRDPKSNQSPAPAPSSMHDDNSAWTNWPKKPQPVVLSYYYDSNDGHDLKQLVKDHHLRRRKDCDGLENFTYDLDVIAFFLGVIAAGIGLYSDVIPFFNDGVKITYNNEHLGDGVDFPHDYWPKHHAHIDAARQARTGALNQMYVLPEGSTIVGQAVSAPVASKRTIYLGDKEDNVKEVLSVVGEFIGMIGLAISFVALFPHLVEKFFYTLDWWFGKRGLWKQYLYTYKCEVHPYPQPMGR